MATVAHTASFSNATTTATPSFTTVAIGANGGSDILYFGVGSRFTTTVTTVSATIDGVAASQIVEIDTNTATGDICAIFALARNSLPDPTQTDVDIAITYNAAVLRTAGEMYVSPDASATATDTASDFETGASGIGALRTLTLSVDCTANDIVIGYAFCGATAAIDPPTWAWTGATEDVDGQFASTSSVRTSAHANNASAATPRTVTAAVQANVFTESVDPVGVAASFPVAAAPAAPKLLSLLGAGV